MTNAAWAKDRDPARPLHYEQDKDAEVVDISSRMYLGYDELEDVRRAATSLGWRGPAGDARRRAQPMILCEYGHAMGNGPGGLIDYERIFDASSPGYGGGFIWEWIDHAIDVAEPG